MMYSRDAVRLIEAFESCNLVAYPDQGGVLTIGWGHTAGVYKGQVITQALADKLLGDDMNDAAATINRFVEPKLTQWQFDALVSFVFNVGPGKKGVKAGFVFLKNGEPSTMLKFLNQGAMAAAATQFDLWCNVKGIPSAGLSVRRIAERHLFLHQSLPPMPPVAA